MRCIHQHGINLFVEYVHKKILMHSGHNSGGPKEQCKKGGPKSHETVPLSLFACIVFSFTEKLVHIHYYIC